MLQKSSGPKKLKFFKKIIAISQFYLIVCSRMCMDIFYDKSMDGMNEVQVNCQMSIFHVTWTMYLIYLLGIVIVLCYQRCD